MDGTRDLSIRPLGVGGMIDRAVAVTLRHFRALFLVMLVFQGLAGVLQHTTLDRAGELVPLLADPPAMAARAAALAPRLAGALVALLALQYLATAAATAIVAPTLAPGLPRPARARAARAALAGMLLQVVLLLAAPALGAAPGLWLAWRAGSAAAALLGLLGAVVGALLAFLVALLRSVLAPAAAGAEGRGGLAALGRSARLMAPRPGQPLLERPGLRASLLLLATFVLALAVSGLATLPRLLAGRLAGGGALGFLPGALPAPVEAALALFEVCANAAIMPFSLGAVAVLYFERRARAEGVDLEAWAAGLEAR